jgi:hypothetical protein
MFFYVLDRGHPGLLGPAEKFSRRLPLAAARRV